jgi:DNA replication licensing factor MCM4
MAVRDILRELTEFTNMDVSQDEVIHALRTMEADGFIQFNERAQTVFVRTGVAT